MTVRRRNPAPFVALVAVFLAVTCSSAAFAVVGSKPKPKPKTKVVLLAGAWSGSYTGPVSGTFKIHWTQKGSTLTGSITLSSPPGSYGINGHVSGGTIQFGAVGAGATYTGSVSGTSMSGNWKSPIGGGKWSAHRS